jgi:F-type H+-transporting ATPase subunit delta
VPDARARRYAKAVFDLAREKGQVDAWADRLDAVRGVLAEPQARGVLFNPAIPLVKRVEVVGELTDGLGKESANLARMMVATGRPELIDGVVAEYRWLADAEAGRVRATATTAVELEAADYERLAKELSERLGKDVRLEVKVDAAIIGGMVLQIGDRLVDASVATRLQQLRRRLATA